MHNDYIHLLVQVLYRLFFRHHAVFRRHRMIQFHRIGTDAALHAVLVFGPSRGLVARVAEDLIELLAPGFIMEDQTVQFADAERENGIEKQTAKVIRTGTVGIY